MDGSERLEGARHGARPLRLRHSADPAELRGIRRSVGRWAELNALTDNALIDLQLAVGEAVSNGVEHAYAAGADEAPTVAVELEIRSTSSTPVVAVRVVDHGHWQPAAEQPGYRGRGLALIERLSCGLTVTHSGTGTQVCFDIPLTKT